ncbi:unnamed protein product [Larinioides sclopetarius]|uniref:Uncharacterized protein n=1 Tax=Larinioides sclopetarius TaxID=280406 RepID=A0AAV2BR89_9ARAC
MKQLPRHAELFHGIDLKTMCPYCQGEYKWTKGEKIKEPTTLHFMKCITECFEKFKIKTNSLWLPKVSSICKSCRNFKPKSRELFGHRKDRMNEYVGLYDPCFEKPEMWETNVKIFNEKSGIKNDLIGIMDRFLRDDMYWYHLMIKNDMFPTFIEEMKKISGEIVVLPYWCLCDGLTKKRIVHRHMILACEKESSFYKIWRDDVKFEEKNSGKCKDRRKITDLFHLMNTIQYVSQRKASCDGRRIRNEVDENNSRQAHFYLNNHLPDHGNEIYVFGRIQENTMSQLKYRIEYLKDHYESLTSELKTENQKLKRKCAESDKGNDMLKKKIKTMEDEMKNMGTHRGILMLPKLLDFVQIKIARRKEEVPET